MTTNEFSKSDIKRLLSALEKVRSNVSKIIIGQEQVVSEMLTGLIAGGHCLIEGVPGLGKTLLVRSLAQALQLKFGRIQFTPDLMPSDIIGTEVIEEDLQTGKKSFRFNPGPVFANLLLADEINRTPPKTQAALLQAMQERSVTYSSKTHTLDPPFFVLATQNPLEQSGTYELPEAQLDRFLLHIEIDYPEEVQELNILEETTGGERPEVNAEMEGGQILELQTVARQIHVSSSIFDYINRLVRSTRPQVSSVKNIVDCVKWGAGPRGGQSLVLAAKAKALIEGRLSVTREDVRDMALPVLRHRLLLNFHAQAEQVRVGDIIEELLQSIPGPEENLGS
ncbi:MAG: MoxR family ATPase [Pseudomonadota bacterium]